VPPTLVGRTAHQVRRCFTAGDGDDDSTGSWERLISRCRAGVGRGEEEGGEGAMWAPGLVPLPHVHAPCKRRLVGRPARAGPSGRGVGGWEDDEVWEAWAVARLELMGRDRGSAAGAELGTPPGNYGNGVASESAMVPEDASARVDALPAHWQDEAREWGGKISRQRPRRGRPRGKKDQGEMAEYISGHTTTYLRLARRCRAWRTSFGLVHGRDPTVGDMSQDVVRLHVAMFTIGDILRSRED